MRRIEHGLDLPEGFTSIDRASIIIDVAGQMLEVPLTPKQLHAVFVALGIEVDATGVEMLDDTELGDVIEGLEPQWVSVPKAAEMLGVTKGRAYAIVRSGGLVTRDDMGPRTMVNVESIRERLADPPKAGRRW